MNVSLKRIFTALVIYQHNMKMIHWNCCGCHFDNIHAISNDYYDKMQTHIDEIAEIMMMIGEKPLSLREVFDFAENDDASYEVFNSSHDGGTEFFGSMSYMMTHLISLYEDACHNELPGDIISKLQEHQYFYRLENDYKLKRRLMEAH